MRISCQKCGYRFEDPLDVSSSEPAQPRDCPHCGSQVDVRAQIVEMASRTTDGGAHLPDPETPGGSDLSDRSIGGYEILEEISRGAMGVVYKARHRSLRRVVALKVLIAGEHASKEQVVRFEKEARAAARLRHPNIVPIYEVGIEKGKRFFTMDFIEGTPLDVLIARRELTPRRALEIASQVADALQYAHEQGVIHRDIKPSNIMIDQDGRPQIMDFGLAKQLDTDTKFTRTGTTIGTPSYMSPEQAQGENDRIDRRSDVYSLGAVLYEMLTGRPPFTGETMMNIVMKVIHDEPVPPRRLNRRLHRDIQTIVLKAMEKEPARRYQRMGELGADIRRYMAGEMIAARPAGPVRRTGKYLRKHKTTVLVGISIALIASLISGLIIYTVIREQDQRRIALREEQEEAARAQLEQLLTLEEQEPEWVPRLEEEFDGDALAHHWIPSHDAWSVQDGQLTITEEARGPSHVLLDHLFQGNIIIEYEARTLSETARINCFLGPNPRLGYAFRYGEWDGHNISLLRRGQLLAQVEVPPLQPDIPYRFRLERRGSTLIFQATGNGETHELRYEDPALLQELGEIRFGLDTWASTVHFDRLTISREEFLGEHLNKLQAIEYYMLSKGLLSEALAEYEDLIDKHAGRPIAVLAEYHRGLIAEVLSEGREEKLKEALGHYKRFEGSSGLLDPKYSPLIAHNQERKFFVLVRLGRYDQAAEELARAAAAGHQFQPGSVWKFPAILSRYAGDLAFSPAVRIMEDVRFRGDRPRLRDYWEIVGQKKRREFTSALNEISRGLATQKRYDEMQRAFLALPDLGVTRSFELAVADTLDDHNHRSALELLGFAHEHGMVSRRMERAALDLAGRFVAAGQYKRVSNVRQAYPVGGLARHFNDAIIELVAAGDQSGAVELFDEACQHFEEDRQRIAGAARELMAACLESNQYVEVRRLFDTYGDPGLARYLFDAARKQIEEGDPDEAYAALEHIRANLPERENELARLAGALATRYVRAGRPNRLVQLADDYPDPHLAAPFIAAINDMTWTSDNPELVLVMSRGLAQFPDNEGILGSVSQAARALIQQGDIEAAVRPYHNAARAQGDDQGSAARLWAAAAVVLYDAGAYAEGASAFATAGRTAPEGTDEGSGWLIRAGSIYLTVGDTAAADGVWQELRRQPRTDMKGRAVAQLMIELGATDEFDSWQSAHADHITDAEAAFFIGLRAVTLDRLDVAREMLTKARDAEEGAWFRALAEILTATMPGPEPVSSRTTPP